MLILLLRHGDAGDAGPAWPDDRKRPLTDKGIEQARRQGRLAASLGLAPTRACSSPLVRARETAEHFLLAFENPPEIKVHPELAPGGEYEELMSQICALEGDGAVLCCGHNPSIGMLSGLLGRELEFSKGMLAVFNWDGRPGRAQLELLARASMLKNL